MFKSEPIKDQRVSAYLVGVFLYVDHSELNHLP